MMQPVRFGVYSRAQLKRRKVFHITVRPRGRQRKQCPAARELLIKLINTSFTSSLSPLVRAAYHNESCLDLARDQPCEFTGFTIHRC